MPTAIARASRVPIAPRKMRLVADLIRGKKVAEARDILLYTAKVSAPIIKKVLDSAVANAENTAAETRERIDTDSMTISTILINEAETLRRYQPRARGRANRIRKRSSHVELTITGQ